MMNNIFIGKWKSRSGLLIDIIQLDSSSLEPSWIGKIGSLTGRWRLDGSNYDLTDFDIVEKWEDGFIISLATNGMTGKLPLAKGETLQFGGSGDRDTIIARTGAVSSSSSRPLQIGGGSGGIGSVGGGGYAGNGKSSGVGGTGSASTSTTFSQPVASGSGKSKSRKFTYIPDRNGTVFIMTSGKIVIEDDVKKIIITAERCWNETTGFGCMPPEEIT